METITSSAEISQLFSSGKRLKTPYITFIVGEQTSEHYRSNDEQHDHHGRVAFIAGKKLGNAVWRNSAKRRLRALCREMGGPWPGKDVVFLARGSLCNVPYQKVLQSCGSARKHLAFHEEERSGEKAR